MPVDAQGRENSGKDSAAPPGAPCWFQGETASRERRAEAPPPSPLPAQSLRWEEPRASKVLGLSLPLGQWRGDEGANRVAEKIVEGQRKAT